MSPFVIVMLNLYSTKQQRERVDNSLSLFLEANGWKQNFSYDFIKLALGYLAVGVALVVYWYEAYSGKQFNEVRLISGFLCAIYFAIQLYIWYSSKYVEKGAMFIGSKNDQTIYIIVKDKSNLAEYSLEIHLQDQKFEHSFLYNELVDEMGVVHNEKFQPVLDLLERKNK